MAGIKKDAHSARKKKDFAPARAASGYPGKLPPPEGEAVSLSHAGRTTDEVSDRQAACTAGDS